MSMIIHALPYPSTSRYDEDEERKEKDHGFMDRNTVDAIQLAYDGIYIKRYTY